MIWNLIGEAQAQKAAAYFRQLLLSHYTIIETWDQGVAFSQGNKEPIFLAVSSLPCHFPSPCLYLPMDDWNRKGDFPKHSVICVFSGFSSLLDALKGKTPHLMTYGEDPADDFYFESKNGRVFVKPKKRLKPLFVHPSFSLPTPVAFPFDCPSLTEAAVTLLLLSGQLPK